MKTVIFSHIPPRSEMLSDGSTRVYLSWKEVTNTYTAGEDNHEEQVTEYEVTYTDVKEPTYENIIRSLVSQRYTIEDELAVMRQFTNKPDEYEDYNSYVESCKQMAKVWSQK